MRWALARSGLPVVLLRDAQVLAAVSITFSLLGGILQELHRSVGASQWSIVATQVASNLVVSMGTVATVLVFYLLTMPSEVPSGVPRKLREAWRAERPYPWWIGAIGGALGGAIAGIVVSAESPLFLILASGAWMLMATLLVRAVTNGARRIDAQSTGLSDAVEELYESRSQIIAADIELRQSIAEQLHGPAQSQLLSLERDLMHAGRVAEAERLAEFRATTIRDLAHRLHPAIVDIGLLPALDELTAHAAVQCTIQASTDVVKLDDLGSSAMDSVIRLAIYRTCQEALNNAIAAQAQSIEIELTVKDSNLVVQIHNDGATVSPPVRPGLGLRTIEAWIGRVGGTWFLEPRTDSPTGATLRACVPIASHQIAR